ncbi:MAG: alpha/beta hydrolase [Leptospiraceae bacterium]|nr:alpha/beta hydrolase [Leptospiraceae bacterium]
MKKISLFIGMLFVIIACSSNTKTYTYPSQPEKIGKTKTIVFIHGLYLTSFSWEEWKKYFEAKGYKVYTQPYPYLEDSAEIIRKRQPDKNLTNLKLNALKEHYKKFLSTLNEKPILVGHSLGGLMAQMLLNEGLASGAIAIDSAPPNGIVSKATALFAHGYAFVKNGMPFISPFASDDEAVQMTEEKFKSEFANGISEPLAKKLYNDYYIPASRRLGKDTLTELANVDNNKPHAPLLLITGSIDRIIPTSVTKDNYSFYNEKSGILTMKEFKDKGHFIAAQEGWQEVADYSLKWIEENR